MSVNTGGLTHEKNKFYMSSISCIIYLVLLIVLVNVNIMMAMHAFNGEINRVDTSHKPIDHFNLNLKEVREDLQFQIKLHKVDKSDFKCDSIDATIKTSSIIDIHMNCKSISHSVSLTIPEVNDNMHVDNITLLEMSARNLYPTIQIRCRDKDPLSECSE